MTITKSFTDYLKDAGREYSFRIKTVSPLDDDHMEYIERVLQKYVLTDITKPIKTIMQKHPLDFPDIRNHEVWIVDVVTQLPASAYVLQQELKLALKLPEKYIVVRAENDPLEVYTQEIDAKNEIDIVAAEKGLSPASRLSTNRHYDEDERAELDQPAYGDEYNSAFLDTIAKVKAERDAAIVSPQSEELNQGGDVEDSEVAHDDGTFNAEIKDAPKPHTTNEYMSMLKNLRKTEKAGDPRLSTVGNYDDDEIKQSKKYDKYGKNDKVAVVTITHEREGIRKK